MESTDSRPALERDKPINFPRAILLAVDAALHIKNLPRRLRLTLAEIGRHVSQYAPTSKTVWPSKESIAAALGYTARTIYNHLAELEELQLIRRIPPKRTRFQTDAWHTNGHIALTDLGAQLLGLQVVHTGTEKISVSSKQTESTTTKNHPPKRESRIPDDLKLLEERKVSAGGIFGLMREARERGQRLGDIVTATGERLRELSGGGLRNYLRKLIHGPTDWRAKAAAIREREKPRQYAHRRYAGQGGLMVRIFDGIAEVTRDGQWLEAVPKRDMHRVYAWIESGKLVEIMA